MLEIQGILVSQIKVLPWPLEKWVYFTFLPHTPAFAAQLDFDVL